MQANQEFNHSRAFGAYVEIVEDADAHPTIAVWVDEEDRFAAQEACTLAQDLITAIQKLVEIQASAR